ncbi:MAG: hypothetical protein OEY29_08465 [Gammaproteobacteria bacterium]|nr:hypothetical protein [Gammaproteobacteria bacterium]
MTVMLWQGLHLVSRYAFEDDQLAELSEYLESSKEITASVVIDVLEEEITLTSIPHVSARERKFLIDRALTRLHRGTEFATANIVGRDNNRRRDDRLLVSGMTSSRPLLKWLDLLNQHSVHIKGVYSLPLISGHVLKALKISKGLTLLVSRQSRNFIRQSIFKDGRLIYSRNIPSSQNLNIKMFSADLKKTKKYLENQKLVNAEDRVDVLVLASNRFFTQLEGLDELLPDMNISYVRHDSMKSTLGIKSDLSISGQEVFSSLLLGSMTKNHYGRENDLACYNRKIREKWINYSSVLAAVLLIFVTAVFYIDINVIEQKVDGVEEQLKILKLHNDRLENNLSKLPAKAEQMKLFVNNIDDIEQAARSGLDSSLIVISQVLSAYENISLQSLSWSVNEAVQKSKSKAVAANRRKNKVAGSKINPQSIAKVSHVVELTASVNLAVNTNEQSAELLNNFITAIKNIKSVHAVNVTKHAIKSGSTETMTGVLSGKANDKSELSLTLIIGGADNEG